MEKNKPRAENEIETAQPLASNALVNNKKKIGEENNEKAKKIMKTITSTMLALAAASLLSQNALATTSWQMQYKHGDANGEWFFDRAKAKKSDYKRIRNALKEMWANDDRPHIFTIKSTRQSSAGEEGFSKSIFSERPVSKKGLQRALKKILASKKVRFDLGKYARGKHARLWKKWDTDGGEWKHERYDGPGPSPVPIPAAAWLMLSALGVLGGVANRRRQTAIS